MRGVDGALLPLDLQGGMGSHCWGRSFPLGTGLVADTWGGATEGIQGGEGLFFSLQLLKKIYFNLFLAVLGLRFCARAFSSCGKRGPLFIAVRGPLIIAASLAVEHRRQTHRLSSCGSRAQLLRGVWDLPRPGLEPVFPPLAGRFSTTAPPGKPFNNTLKCIFALGTAES